MCVDICISLCVCGYLFVSSYILMQCLYYTFLYVCMCVFIYILSVEGVMAGCAQKEAPHQWDIHMYYTTSRLKLTSEGYT